jgi:putrescine aminotransferase
MQSDGPTHFDETFNRYLKYVNPGMATIIKFMGYESAEDHSRGCYVYGSDGKAFLDLLGGPGVFTTGHSHPRIIAAAHAQLDKMALGSHMLLSPGLAEVSERLAAITPGDLQYSFFCNSGAEAVEGALKVARAFTGRKGFVAAEGAFHGKTFGALSASGRDVYKDPFRPLMDGFTHVPFGDADALRAAVGPDTAAVLLEPIQCEAGIRIPPEGYIRAAREICDAAGALLILDEIQTGLGRTGKMFACDWDGVAPDIMTLGKAIGGGVMPVGAFIATAPIWSVFDENPYIHTSTFGGSPLACAVAMAALDVIEEEGLAEKSAVRGAQLLAGVQKIGAEFGGTIKDVRGRGLLVGVEFANNEVGELTIAGMAQRNVLIAYTLNNPSVIRLEPPAVITEAQVDEAVKLLRDAIEATLTMLAMLDLNPDAEE